MNAIEPPTQTGWATQVSSEAMAATGRPKAFLHQTYTPPSPVTRLGLGEDQAVGHQEEDGEHQCPGERLRAEAGDLPERLDGHDGRDDQEHDVEPAESLLQMFDLAVGLAVSPVGGGFTMVPCSRMHVTVPTMSGEPSAVKHKFPRIGITISDDSGPTQASRNQMQNRGNH